MPLVNNDRIKNIGTFNEQCRDEQCFLDLLVVLLL